MNISVVTSFNERISRNPKTQILDSFGKLGNNVDISLYHENSYDLKRFGKIIDLSKLDDTVHPVDIFTCWSKFQDLEEGWLEEFVAGANSPFDKSSVNSWNINARYWFRKVAAIYNYAERCNTRYLLWLDSDIHVLRLIDNQFFTFIRKFDICCIKRPKRQTGEHPPFKGSPPETGIICFDLASANVREFIKQWFRYYTDGTVFSDETRWDDTVTFGKLLRKEGHENLKVGTFRSRYAEIDINTSEFDIYRGYFHHFKRGNEEFRLPTEEFMSDVEKRYLKANGD